jgi:AraC-like DNA-binding protein
MSGPLTVSVSLAHYSLLGLLASGAAIEPVLECAGLPSSLLEQPGARIPIANLARLTRCSWNTMGSETNGFTARPVPLGSFAMMCHATITCPNLRRALLRADRFYSLISDEFSIRLDERGDEARLIIRHDNRLGLDNRGFIESLFVFWLRWASWLIDREILPEHIHLGFSPPDYAGEYYQLFPCDHFFDAEGHYLTMASRYLDVPVVRQAGDLVDFLNNAPECLMLRYRSEDSLSAQVRKILKSSLNPEGTSLEDVAASLVTSPQSLRRKLREEGNGFQELKDSVRRQAASQLLLHSGLSVNDIAARLGFSEASAFHRAFRKWTGFTPGQYRERKIG